MIEPKLERLTLILPVVDARPTRPPAPGSAAPSFGDHLQRAAPPAANPPPERSDAGETRPRRDAASQSGAAPPNPTARDRDREGNASREADRSAAEGTDAPPSEDGAAANATPSHEDGEHPDAETTPTDTEKLDTEPLDENALTVQAVTAAAAGQPNLESALAPVDAAAEGNDQGESEGEQAHDEPAHRPAKGNHGQEPANRPAESVENVDKPAAADDADAADARTRNSAQPNTPEKLTIAANSPPRQEDAQQEATDPLINQDSEPTGDVSADKKQTIATKPEIPENVGKEFRSKDGLKRAEQAADTKRTDSGDVKASHTASRAAQAAPPAEKKQPKRATHEVSQVDKSTASSATANHRDALNYNTATTTAPDVADLSTGEKNRVASDAGAEAAESTAKAGSETTSTAEPRSSRRVALPVGTPSGRATGEGDGPNTVGRARFVQRVARAFQALGDRGGPLRLRLSPPELGSLRMEVAVRNGLVTAHIEAESPQARAMLLENLPALRDRLAAQDIKIERFDVDLMDQSPDGLPQTPQEDRRAAQQERRAAANVKRTTQTANDPRNDEVTRPSPAGDGQLNVVV